MQRIASFHAYDQDDIAILSHARGYACILNDISEWLRNEYKHKNHDDETMKLIEEAREFIAEQRAYHHIPEDL